MCNYTRPTCSQFLQWYIGSLIICSYTLQFFFLFFCNVQEMLLVDSVESPSVIVLSPIFKSAQRLAFQGADVA